VPAPCARSAFPPNKPRELTTHSVGLWGYPRKRSIRGIAFHQHLYTRLAVGAVTDELEEWLNQEFETPAQEALDSVRQKSRLTPTTDDTSVCLDLARHH
jgi:hypothetical protein